MQTHDLLDKDGSMVSLLDNNKIENSLEDFQVKSSNDILALDIQHREHVYHENHETSYIYSGGRKRDIALYH